MPGIDPSVMVYRLNVSPYFSPYPSEEASVHLRMRSGYNGKSLQTARCKIHQGSVLA